MGWLSSCQKLLHSVRGRASCITPEVTIPVTHHYRKKPQAIALWAQQVHLATTSNAVAEAQAPHAEAARPQPAASAKASQRAGDKVVVGAAEPDAAVQTRTEPVCRGIKRTRSVSPLTRPHSRLPQRPKMPITPAVPAAALATPLNSSPSLSRGAAPGPIESVGLLLQAASYLDVDDAFSTQEAKSRPQTDEH